MFPFLHLADLLRALNSSGIITKRYFWGPERELELKEMNNVKFNYLYRDAGNYKKWAYVIFSNPDRLSIDRIMEALRGAFLQDGLFIASQVCVPEVFFSTSGDATSDDHCFHELDVVEITLDGPNDRHSRSMREFILEVRREATRGWETFDPHERISQRILD
jgi:hypothetical protein